MTPFWDPLFDPFEPSWPLPLIKPLLNGGLLAKGSKRGVKKGSFWTPGAPHGAPHGALFEPFSGKSGFKGGFRGNGPKGVQKGSKMTLFGPPF